MLAGYLAKSIQDLSPHRLTAMLVFTVLLSAALLGCAKSQCVPNCGCMLNADLCCLEVEENQPAGTRVGNDNTIIESTNPEYSIISNGAPFVINETTGVIYTQRLLDRETESFLETDSICLSVSVILKSDSVVIAQQLVNIIVIDLNDNPPIFSLPEYSINTTETTTDDPFHECTSEEEAMLLVTDADGDDVNTEVIYSVVESDMFTVPDSSTPCVVNVEGFDLDRDTSPRKYTFTLVATNTASPGRSANTTVTYILKDINDNAPHFENETYTIPINENQLEMSFTVTATDADSGVNGEQDLTYSIEGPEGVFEINPSTGLLTLLRSLNAEDESTYEFTISATDGGSPSMTGSVPVTIQVIDLNEKLSYMLSELSQTEIVENSVERFGLIMVADPDSEDSPNNNNSLEIVGLEGLFTITSLIHNNYVLEQIGSVDYEQNRTIQITIRTKEYGTPFLTQDILYNLTVLDVNDNYPTLNKTEFNFTELQEPSDREIVNLAQHTFDLDGGNNGMVGEYQLVSVTGMSGVDLTGMFAGRLDRSTGVLRSGDLLIDREELGNSLVFMVNATDMGDPRLSQILTFSVEIEDVNDNSPVFERPEYTFNVTEGEPINTPVGDTVLATDKDANKNGQIMYSIVGETQFAIKNSIIGSISTDAVFDREILDRYEFTVLAMDSGIPQTEPATAVVTIFITDVNDNDPVFSESFMNFSITTNFRPGDVVGRVLAEDADSSPFNMIEYSIESNTSLFTIEDNTTGEISLKAPPSREGIVMFNVSASNPDQMPLGRKAIVTVIVEITEQPPLEIALIAGVASGASFLLLLIVAVLIVIMCMCCKNRKYKRAYSMDEMSHNNSLNNSSKLQPPILKIPASNNAQGRSRVTFKESVEETHYHQQSVVIDTNDTVRRESITKFDNSPQARHEYSTIPEGGISPEHDCRSDEPLKDMVPIETLEMSPSHMMNGNIPSPSSHHIGYAMPPHSPIVRVVNGGGDDVDFSQYTSSDAHTYMDDEESMYSDDASIVNTALSRYANEHPDLDARYRTPPTHPHLELHHHLPPISGHGQPTRSSLAQLHAHNLAQLAEANRQEYYATTATMHNSSSQLNHSLTPCSDHLQHGSSSTLSTHSPPSPSHASHHTHSHIETTISPSPNHLHSGERHYPHPLVMPDAFPPRDTTEIHGFPIGSYADYGEASTYASTELDAALGFLEIEPGIISLTATDYEDDTEL